MVCSVVFPSESTRYSVLMSNVHYLRVPWTAERSNQSVIKEINPEYSLEGLMLKLKLQYFGHQMQRTDSLEKTLMLEKIEGRRRGGWDGWIALTLWTWAWASSRRWWRTGQPGVLQLVHGVTKNWTQLSDWTTQQQQDFVRCGHKIKYFALTEGTERKCFVQGQSWN